jgi:hypothetical protein
MLQDQAYRDSVLPPDVRKRVSVEAASRSAGSAGWATKGAIIGLDHYGASAPAGTIFEQFGFTTERVAEIARRVVHEGLHGRIPTLEAAPHSPGAGGSHPSVPPGSSGTDRTRAATRATTDRCASPLAADHAGASLKAELLRRLAAELGDAHELSDLGGDGSDPNDDYRTSPSVSGKRSSKAGRIAGSSSAGPAWVRPSRPARCAAFGPRSATTHTRRTRAWSTMT